MVGLHRRGSSAALYVPVHGEPGDITESFSSANRLARTRTGSLTADNTRPAKGELEELEEKESFIPTTRYERPGAAGALGWRDASGRTSRSGRGCGWKGKLVLLVVLGGAIGGAAWFAFFRPESLQEDTWLEAYKPGWWRASLSSVAAEAEATAYGVATGLEANVAWDTATGARDDAYGTATSKWAQASQAAYKGSYNSDGDDYADGDDSDLGDESSELPASSYKDAAVAGVFSAAASELVSTLLDNGTLAAYKWHETLAPLGSAHSKASEGRLLVVGDLHGTHRSLVALLKRLSFSPSSDTLLHVGDLVGKSALNDSLATVSLLRKLGARGVRGNHDQRVLEWRKWMEAYGPLTPSAPSRASASPGAPSSRTSAAVLKVGAALKGMQHRPAGKQVQSGFARVAQAADYARHQAAAASKLQGAHRDASREEERAPMMPRGRKVRRSWMTWLVGDGSDDDEDNEPPLSVFEEPQDDVMVKEDASAAAEDHDVTSFDLLVSAGAPAPSKSSVASKAVSATSKAASGASSASQGGRRPFGRPAALASAATGVPSSSTRTRPSSSSTAARASATVAAPASRLASTFTPVTVYDSTGALLGPSYAHLDPSLTPSQLSSLGLVVPDGWEWGGDHFEIARHLSSADVAYLEQLPLTLWVDELRSYVVHAGMVPWSSLDRVLSRVDGSASAATQKQKQKALAVPATLDSTTPLSFSPSSSLARLLSKDSTRTALVLEKLNTSPSTLLDMRTLAPAGGRKGGDWTVSAKGRKAGKGAVPWWGVWEEGMRECAQRRGCDEVGVLYGHWAGQGLQVQDHSIGLDSGCVYGRRLSALVVPLSSASSPSSSSGPLSPASSAGASSLTSSGKGATPSVSNASSSSNVEAKKHKVKPHSSSSSASSPSPSASSSAEPGATHPDSNSKAKPNWHGGRQRVKGSAAAALASEDVASSATSTRTGPSPSTSTTGRTHASALVDGPSFSDLDPAPSSSSSSAGYDEDEALIVNDDDDAAEADTKPWWRPWKRAYPQGRPGVAPWSGADRSDAAEGEGKEEGEEGAAASPTAARLTAKAKAEALAAQQDGDAFAEDDDAAEAQEVAELIEADDEAEDGGDDDDWASPESAFAQERVVLAAAGPGGKVAWVVSVDCAAEADIE